MAAWTSVAVRQELMDNLQALAKAKGVSHTSIVNEVLEERVKRDVKMLEKDQFEAYLKAGGQELF